MNERILRLEAHWLHNAGFVTLCEGFLGIDPHANLFRAFF
jgi:hypothetical protein